MRIKWGGIYTSFKSWGFGFGVDKSTFGWDFPGYQQWGVWFQFGPWEWGFSIRGSKDN